MKSSYIFLAAWLIQPGHAAEPVVPVAAQPLAANATRLLEALDFLGAPLPETTRKTIAEGTRKMDTEQMQHALDEQALFIVELNPESRVKARRGVAKATLQQGGYTPVVTKIVNFSTVTKALTIASPQAGQV